MRDDALRNELRSAIAGWDQSGGVGLSDDTPLISSGRLDSFNLLRLVLWVEDGLAHAANFLGLWLARRTPTELFYQITYVLMLVISLALIWQGAAAIGAG